MTNNDIATRHIGIVDSNIGIAGNDTSNPGKAFMDSSELNEELTVQIAKARENAASLGTRGSANASLTEPTAENAFYDRNSGRVVV